MSDNFYDALLETIDRPDVDEKYEAKEIVVSAKTGQPRQAGATTPEGAFVKEFKTTAERSLYAFTKGVLGRKYLTPALHLPTCDWLQRCPPHRKMLLLPREHAKTSIVGHALSPHILIQPKESNIYFPGVEGSDQRIYLIGEAEVRATDSMRVVQAIFDSNSTFRAFWPHRCWENSRRDSKKWNDREMIIPRKQEYPDPSIRAIGVGGAITGAHPTVLIKDDLTTLEAANSPVVMRTAIDWHIASRALINAPGCLEFIIGTRWAINDLPQYVMDNDSTVEVLVRAIVEDGLPIFPEMFTLERVAQLKKEFGTLFPLIFMNSAADPTLTDFAEVDLRAFRLVDDAVEYDEDERDLVLSERFNAPRPDFAELLRGRKPSRDEWQELFGRGEYLRLKAR